MPLYKIGNINNRQQGKHKGLNKTHDYPQKHYRNRSQQGYHQKQYHDHRLLSKHVGEKTQRERDRLYQFFQQDQGKHQRVGLEKMLDIPHQTILLYTYKLYNYDGCHGKSQCCGEVGCRRFHSRDKPGQVEKQDKYEKGAYEWQIFTTFFPHGLPEKAVEEIGNQFRQMLGSPGNNAQPPGDQIGQRNQNGHDYPGVHYSCGYRYGTYVEYQRRLYMVQYFLQGLHIHLCFSSLLQSNECLPHVGHDLKQKTGQHTEKKDHPSQDGEPQNGKIDQQSQGRTQ